MTKTWQICDKAPEAFFESFPQYSKFTLQLLYNRELKDCKEIEEFFSSDYERDFIDPFLFDQMEVAVARLKQVILKNEKIGLWGDYDADGVTGVSIMYLLLSKLIPEENIRVYIPDRNKEGHGLNQLGLKELADWGAKVIITIDCGLSNTEEIKLANDLGMAVIICDHHLEPEIDPPALAVLNPKAKKGTYPFRHLAGAGVVFKLVSALIKSLPKEVLESAGLSNGYEKWFLDLVAIATVADYMPLKGENRTLVKYGLYVLSKTNKIGLKTLLGRAGLTPLFGREEIMTNLTTQDLSFSVIPRINAMGRLAHAKTSFQLLVSSVEGEAEDLAKTVETTNKKRQVIGNKLADDLNLKINPTDLFIFEQLEEGNYPGILSSLASRLVESYKKPVFVCAMRDDVSICSVRSADYFNTVEVFDELKDFLVVYGGHQAAGGFTIKNDQIEKFRIELQRVLEDRLKDVDIKNILEVDLEIAFNEIDFKMFNEMKKFEPFGVENVYPRFLIKNLEIINLKFIGSSEKHIKFFLRDKNDSSKTFEALAFNISDHYRNLKINDVINTVVELHLNKYAGKEKLSFKLVDFKKEKINLTTI